MIAFLLCAIAVLQLQVIANARRLEEGETDIFVGLAVLAEAGLLIWAVVLLPFVGGPV